MSLKEEDKNSNKLENSALDPNPPHEDSEELPNIDFNTELTFLKQRYFFHEVIAENEKTRHYIVEDLEIDLEQEPEMSDNLFYYLKQSIFDSKEELQYALDYYRKLISYCLGPHCKNDLTNYREVWDFKFDDQQYYELVVIVDFGESERIDVENIEKEHIDKFIKNVCVLLQDLKQTDELYHGNILLKNIVLDNDELKLSGFKPIFMTENSENWKVEFIKLHGYFRLDLYLLGMLWLKFLNTDVEKLFGKNLKLDEILKEVEKIVKNLYEIQQQEIVATLLDMKNYSDLQVEKVILNFDEANLLKTLKDNEQQYQSKGSEITDKELNLFTKPFESETNTLQEKVTIQQADSQENVIQIGDANFTLQGSKVEDQASQNDLIQIYDVDVLKQTIQNEEKMKPNNFVERRSIDSQTNQILANKIKKHSQQEFRRLAESMEPSKLEKPVEIKEESEDSVEEIFSSKFKFKSEKEFEKLENIIEKEKNDDSSDSEIEVDDVEKEEEKRQIPKAIGKSVNKKISPIKNKFASTMKPGMTKNNDYLNSKLTKSQELKQIQEEVSETDSIKVNNKIDYSQKYIEIKNNYLKKDKKPIPKKKPMVRYKLKKKENPRIEEIPEIQEEVPQAKSKPKRYNFKKKSNSSTQKIITEKKMTEEPEYVFGQKVVKEEKEDPRLEAIIQQEIERKRQKFQEKMELERQKLLKKAEERKKQEEKIKKRIQKQLSKKRKKKKDFLTNLNQNKSRLDKSREVSPQKKTNQINRSIKSSRQIRNNNTKNLNKSKSREKMKSSKKIPSRPKIKQKFQFEKQKQSFEKTNKSIQKNVEMSNYKERSQMFEYNTLNYKNKNIPFKKVFSKYKAQYHQKEDTDKELYQNVQFKTTLVQEMNFQDLQQQNIQNYNPEMKNQGPNNHPEEQQSYQQYKEYRQSNELFTQNDNIDPQEFLAEKQKHLVNASMQYQNEYVDISNSIHQNQNVHKSFEGGHPQKAIKRTPKTKKVKFTGFKSVHENEKQQNLEEEIDLLLQEENQILQEEKLDPQEVQMNLKPEDENLHSSNHNVQIKNNELFEEEIKELLRSQKKSKPEQNINENDKTVQEQEDLKLQKLEEKEVKKAQKQTYKDLVNEQKQYFSKNQENLRQQEDFDVNERDSFENEEDQVRVQENIEQNNFQSKKQQQNLLNINKEIDQKRLQEELLNSGAQNKIPQNRNENKNQKMNKKISNNEFQTIEDIINHEDIEESIEYLQSILVNVSGLQKIELLKTLSVLYFKNKDFESSSNLLKKAIIEVENSQLINKKSLKSSLQISLTLTFMEIKDFHKALLILDNFEHYPIDYFGLRGEVLQNLNRNEEAFQNFHKEFINLIQNTDISSQKEKILQILQKIMNQLISFEENQLIKFFAYAHGQLVDLVESDQKFEGIVEDFLMKVLNNLLLAQNYNLLNYFLNLNVSKKLIDVNSMKESLKCILSWIYTQFSLYLKSIPNFGNQKESFVNFMNYGLFLLQSLTHKNLTVYQDIRKILLYKGIFFLREKAFSSSSKNLLEAFNLTQNELKQLSNNRESFMVLYNLGLSLYNLNENDDALIYFEKIYQNERCDEDILDLSFQQSMKIYFKQEKYVKCVVNTKQWIYKKLQTIKENPDFFKYLSIYFICAQKINQPDKRVTEEIYNQLSQNENFLNKNYLVLFRNLSQFYSKNQEFNKNEEILSKLITVLDSQSENKIEQFITLIDLMHTKLVLQKEEEAYELNNELVNYLKNKKISLQENTENIENYLYNFLFLVLAKMPLNTRNFDSSFRQGILDKIKTFKQNHQIKDKIYELLENGQNLNFGVNRQEKRIKAGYLEKFQNYQDNSKNSDQDKDHSDFQDSRIHQKKRKYKKRTTFQADKFIKISNFKKKTKCKCYQLNFKKPKILKFVQQLFSTIESNSPSIDVFEQEYKKIEHSMKTQKFRWEKFIYLKQIHKFMIVNQHDSKNSKKQVILFKSLLEISDLCIHDLDNILKIFEFLNSKEIIETFLQFLHKSHFQLAKYIIDELFMNNFTEKFDRTLNSWSDIIFLEKNNLIQNYPFIHCLQSKEISCMEKRIPDYFEIEMRFEIQDDHEFFSLFCHYLGKDQIHQFYLDYLVYSSMEKVVREQSLNSFELLSDFLENLVGIFMEAQIEYLKDPHYFYKLLILINFVKIKSSNQSQIVQKILQLMFFIESKLNQNSFYHFSLFSSFIGNIFYKNKLFEASIKAKSMAFESAKKISQKKNEFPSFFPKFNQKFLMKDILGFMFMNQLQLNKINFASKFLEKLTMIPASTAREKLEQLIFQLYFHLKSSNFSIFEQLLKQEINFSDKEVLSDLEEQLIQTTIESLKLQFTLNLGDIENLQHQRDVTKKVKENLLEILSYD